MTAPRILLLGVGNLLLGDEGIGVHVAQALDRFAWPPAVTVLDGGTGGFHLLSHLESADVAVLIDATLDGNAPGTVTLLEPRYPSDLPRSLTAHDIGLRDLVESAALLGMCPRLLLVAVSVATLQPMQTTLSAELQAAVPEVVDLVRHLVARLLGDVDSAGAEGGVGDVHGTC